MQQTGDLERSVEALAGPEGNEGACSPVATSEELARYGIYYGEPLG